MNPCTDDNTKRLLFATRSEAQAANAQVIANVRAAYIADGHTEDQAATTFALWSPIFIPGLRDESGSIRWSEGEEYVLPDETQGVGIAAPTSPEYLAGVVGGALVPFNSQEWHEEPTT